MFNFFKNLGKKRMLGVDIGTSSIKVVELSKQENHFKLETYGTAQMTYKKHSSGSPINVTVEALGELMEKAKVSTKNVVASLPTSTVFVTVIEIPQVSEKQLAKAIEYEAKKAVPLPLEDMTVSWNIIPPLDAKKKSDKQSVLLTAVPNHVIANYIKIFQKLKLEPQAIEVEAIALVRSLIGQDNSTVIMLDIGSKTATVNLIDRGFIYFSKSLAIGSEAITASIAKTLDVDLERAEEFKQSVGISDDPGQSDFVPESLRPILDTFKNETEQLLHLSQAQDRPVQKIILTGGGSRLLGLPKYLEVFKIPVVLGDPWARVIVPESIKPLVKELGPSLGVSIGLAMRQNES